MIEIDNQTLEENIFNVNDCNFNELALMVFNFQYNHNETYRNYCNAIKVVPSLIQSIDKIPYLPIQFFKNNEIKSTAFNEMIVFESSGTTGSINSKHYVKKTSLYEKSFIQTFNQFYGNETDYCIIGLLPSYLERKGSSLVYMVDTLAKNSKHTNSGFYLYNFKNLKEILEENESKKQPTILIGVTYALLDFAEAHEMKLAHTIVMETGGMKGRREELTRKQVHTILTEKLGLQKIHSEYGMTELLSQAYSKGDGIFFSPHYLKILIRKEDDPFDIESSVTIKEKFINGCINIIDLANLYSCSFIATDDYGKLYNNDSFEINGRIQNSDIRGCGLMLI